MARVRAASQRPAQSGDAPYAPSPEAAPFVTLGYRELGADLMFVRMVGYYGSADNDADTLATLADTIATLDPRFRRVYEFGAVASTSARRGVDNEIRLRAIALLAKAGKNFPREYRFPNLAGQIYLVDLETRDPEQRRLWDEQGTLLLESASRKPGAPADAALHAAVLQTRFGQRQRAIDGLRELLLITSDRGARERIVEQLAKLADEDADAIAAEMLEARKTFDNTWLRVRPAVPASMYVLIDKSIPPGFDLAELATGGRDLIGTEGFERLEPLTGP
jgi:hypothetical protein